MSSAVSSVFGGGKKQEAAPVAAALTAPAAPAAPAPIDAALRSQLDVQRVAGAEAGEAEVDALGNAVPKKRAASKAILG